MSFQDTGNVDEIPLTRQRLPLGAFPDKRRVLRTCPRIAAMWESNVQVLVSEQDVML